MPTTRQDVEIVRPGQEPAFSECVESLLARVREAGWTRHVIINLTDVSYLSSSNLTQLLKLRHATRVQDVLFVLTGCSEQVMSEFVVTSLDRVFEISPDEASATRVIELATSGE